MTASKVLSNGERLAAVKGTLPTLERERDAVMAARRECLLNDDVDGRRRCDDQLAQLKLDLQAAHDKVELLGRAGPVVVQAPEQRGWTWPSTLEDATAQLLAVEPQIVRMRAVKPVDRSAAFDAALDSLVNRQYRLLRLVESFAPKSMVAS